MRLYINGTQYHFVTVGPHTLDVECQTTVGLVGSHSSPFRLGTLGPWYGRRRHRGKTELRDDGNTGGNNLAHETAKKNTEQCEFGGTKIRGTKVVEFLSCRSGKNIRHQPFGTRSLHKGNKKYLNWGD